MDSASSEREAISQLVRELGEARGSRPATPEEVAWLRDFFGRRVLSSYVDGYVQRKYEKHVGENEEWPDDTTAEEYLQSLRDTVLDARGGIYLTDDTEDRSWTIYFVGRVRRAWRGRHGSNRVLVIFNGERPGLVTGFQPDDDDDYISFRSGFWLR